MEKTAIFLHISLCNFFLRCQICESNILVAGIYRACRFIKNPRYPKPINELHLAMGFHSIPGIQQFIW
ncbi:hypothetical protein NDU88_000926 [Pleurodeles waltl]|uniref:Secreted protein n=1 Tax=Pleurodeles waltl TaxID=8319 RepID=A0AAV7RBH3_PLEWA|nr:hypothetical protein NDU88_000926 [Pleurodeles waltl]